MWLKLLATDFKLTTTATPSLIFNNQQYKFFDFKSWPWQILSFKYHKPFSPKSCILYHKAIKYLIIAQANTSSLSGLLLHDWNSVCSYWNQLVNYIPPDSTLSVAKHYAKCTNSQLLSCTQSGVAEVKCRLWWLPWVTVCLCKLQGLFVIKFTVTFCVCVCVCVCVCLCLSLSLSYSLSGCIHFSFHEYSLSQWFI